PLADDRLRVELIDSQLRRPEHLPEPLRSRPFADRLLAWSLADASTPTRPEFIAVRPKQGRGELERIAELQRPPGNMLIDACGDGFGNRHVRIFGSKSGAQ